MEIFKPDNNSYVDQSKFLEALELTLKIPKKTIVLGMVAIVVFVVFLGFGVPFMCNAACFIPAVYMSLESYEISSPLRQEVRGEF